jgi:hypothetical protein
MHGLNHAVGAIPGVSVEAAFLAPRVLCTRLGLLGDAPCIPLTCGLDVLGAERCPRLWAGCGSGSTASESRAHELHPNIAGSPRTVGCHSVRPGATSLRRASDDRSVVGRPEMQQFWGPSAQICKIPSMEPELRLSGRWERGSRTTRT